MRRQLVKRISNGDYIFFCPGCKTLHSVGEDWGFSGTENNPRFSSCLVFRNRGTGKIECHLYIRDKTLFYMDCKHSLSGKQVPMVDVRECYNPQPKKVFWRKLGDKWEHWFKNKVVTGIRRIC